MRTLLLCVATLGIGIVALAANGYAQEKAQSTKAMYMVTGLH